MTTTDEQDPLNPTPGTTVQSTITWDARDFPWWLVAMIGIILFMAVAVITNEDFRNAFDAIFPVPLKLTKGLALTLILTGASFVISVVVGLAIALIAGLVATIIPLRIGLRAFRRLEF